eukprot:COSAG02_NODE_13759_length_1353_cov_1.412281_3_plen_45_part_01
MNNNDNKSAKKSDSGKTDNVGKGKRVPKIMPVVPLEYDGSDNHPP